MERLASLGELGELHPPYMNFMGPKTEVEDRLSLNYKGRDGIKRGTANYFLPTTYSDLVSFEHDLLYWSPNNIVKAYADEKFLKDIRSLAGLIGISGQYIRRYGIEGLVGLSSSQQIIKSTKDLLVKLSTIKDFLNRRTNINRSIDEVRDVMRAYVNLIGEMNPNVVNTRDLSIEDQMLLYDVTLDREAIIRNSRRIRNELLSSFFFNILPSLVTSAYFLAPTIYNNVVKLYKQGTSLLVEDKEYIDIQKRVDKVKDKYVEYLNIVGDFKDTPSFKSLVKLFRKGEGEKVFKIKSEYNKDEAKKTYVEFYDEFTDYMKYMNEKYKNVKDYEPFDIKELNEDNLFKIVDMENVPSSFYEEIAKWSSDIGKKAEEVKNKTQGADEGDKNKTQGADIDVPPLDTEIIKVLEGEQDGELESQVIDIDVPPLNDDIEIDVPQLT